MAVLHCRNTKPMEWIDQFRWWMALGFHSTQKRLFLMHKFCVVWLSHGAYLEIINSVSKDIHTEIEELYGASCCNCEVGLEVNIYFKLTPISGKGRDRRYGQHSLVWCGPHICTLQTILIVQKRIFSKHTEVLVWIWSTCFKQMKNCRL